MTQVICPKAETCIITSAWCDHIHSVPHIRNRFCGVAGCPDCEPLPERGEVKMENKIETALKELHDACDKLNGEQGDDKKLCLFCGSYLYDGTGIVHNFGCPIRNARVALYTERAGETGGLNYPKHDHPHGVLDMPENPQRIWICEECTKAFYDAEVRRDGEAKEWGHRCKSGRCESHLEAYIPEIKHSQPVPPVPDLMLTDEEIRAIKESDYPIHNGKSPMNSLYYALLKAQLKACQDYYQPLLSTEQEQVKQLNLMIIEMLDLTKKEREQHYAQLTALRKDWQKSDHEIEQILGKALGYPAYKDDLKNFPNATEAYGVCVGDNVPASLAMEIAKRLTANEAKIRELSEEIGQLKQGDKEQAKKMISRAVAGFEALQKGEQGFWKGYWQAYMDYGNEQLKSEGKGK